MSTPTTAESRLLSLHAFVRHLEQLRSSIASQKAEAKLELAAAAANDDDDDDVPPAPLDGRRKAPGQSAAALSSKDKRQQPDKSEAEDRLGGKKKRGKQEAGEEEEGNKDFASEALKQPASPSYQPPSPTYQPPSPTYQPPSPTYQPASPTYQPSSPPLSAASALPLPPPSPPSSFPFPASASASSSSSLPAIPKRRRPALLDSSPSSPSFLAPPPPPPSLLSTLFLPSPPPLLSALPSPWDSGSDPHALVVRLPSFHADSASEGKGYNTVAISFVVPAQSDQFAINVLGTDPRDKGVDPGTGERVVDPDFEPRSLETILLHCNPRKNHRGGRFLVTDKQSLSWDSGGNIDPMLDGLPLIFGTNDPQLMVIQIRAEGFDIFLRPSSDPLSLFHCVRMHHRTELPPPDVTDSLYLHFPLTPDHSKAVKNLIRVTSVSWGNAALQSSPEPVGVAGFGDGTRLHPTKLHVSILYESSPCPTSGVHRAVTTDWDATSAERTRAILERKFRPYCLDDVPVVEVRGKYAFVKVGDEAEAERAMAELGGQYKITRAIMSGEDVAKERKEREERARMEAEAGPEEEEAWD